MDEIIQQVRAAFGEFMSGNRNLRERARQHGEALTRLRERCKEEGVNFTEVYADLGIPGSTVYEHVKLAEVWETVKEAADTFGVEFDKLSIRDVLYAVRHSDGIAEALAEINRLSICEPGKKKSGKKAEGKKKLVTFLADPDGKKLSNRKPNRAEEAREEAAKAFIHSTFGVTAKVFYQRRNQKIDVHLTDEIVLIVPVK